MKRVSLAALATLALIGAAACQDALTSPQVAADAAARLAIASNPPPPPIDTGATGFFSAAELRAPAQSPFLQPRFSIQQLASPLRQQPKLSILGGAPRQPASSFEQSPFSFSVPVTYFFNPTSKAGYLHFSSDAENDVGASANGMIKVKNGVLSGKGMLNIQTDAGMLVIDLSSIQQPPSFLGCELELIFDAPTRNEGGVCFHLFFSEATLYPTEGDPIEGTAQMNPGCPPDNEDCFIIE